MAEELLTKTIQVAGKELKDGEYPRVSIKDSDGDFYTIFENKKEGGKTKAFEQSQKVNIGDSVDVHYKENKYTNKGGTESTGRNIAFFAEAKTSGTPVETDLTKRVNEIDNRLRKLEMAMGGQTLQRGNSEEPTQPPIDDLPIPEMFQ